jgi:hypothetical protein
MVSRMSHGLIWSYPSRKKLFLLVVVVIGTLTILSIFLFFKSREIETVPQMPLARPIVYQTPPGKSAPTPAISLASI